MQGKKIPRKDLVFFALAIVTMALIHSCASGPG